MPPTQRLDFLRECNDQHIPVDDFKRAFCDRCINSECSRSSLGKSKFDQRVGSWEERLFSNVPRMDASDERFPVIASKKFLSFGPPASKEEGTVSAWHDPAHLPPMTPEAPSPLPAPPETPSPEVASPRPQGKLPAHMLLANTAAPRGVVLAGSPAAPPPRDPWAPPEAPKDPVVAVGSRVKMGGSGV